MFLRYIIIYTALLMLGVASSSAQTQIPLEMNIEAPHQIEITGAEDASFSYDGQTLSSPSSDIIMCLSTTTEDIILDVTTENEGSASFNSLKAPEISTHISYRAIGFFDTEASGRSLFNNASEQFDLSAITQGLEGCPANDFAFTLSIIPIMEPTAGAISVDEAVDIESLIGAGAKTFSDVITLTFTPDINGAE